MAKNAFLGILAATLLLTSCAGPGILDDPMQECQRVGGEWREFPNSCIDSCELARNPEVISCAQVLTEGCECGMQRCWNGETCVDV